MSQMTTLRADGSLGRLLVVGWAVAFCCAAMTRGASSWQGTLGTNTVWGPSQSPCTVTGELTVPAGGKLTIQPGTTVLFSADVRMVVRGRLAAEGTPDKPIRFTRAANKGYWLGIQFKDTMQDNRIRHALLEYARTNDGMIGLDKSRLLLEYVEFDHCDRRRIRTISSSLIVRRCLFDDIFGPTEAPTSDNMSEHLWGSGIPDGGWLLVEENVFGRCKGHNDVIDFDGPSRPKPIPYILNNVFLGGGDDALDLECDAFIDGNLFMNFIEDQYNKAVGESNVLSAGAGKNYVFSHNVIVNSHYVAQVKNDAFLTYTNNTAVNITKAVIYLDINLPGRYPGRGTLVENSIFWKTASPFRGVLDKGDIVVNHSCLPSAWHYLGTDNIDRDPLFVSDGYLDTKGTPKDSQDDVWVNGDYHLKSKAGRWDEDGQRWVVDGVTSPCIDTGDPDADWTAELWPHGGRINMGAYGGTTQASMSLSPVGIPIDLDHDGTVDARDLLLLAADWLTAIRPVAADIDRDGTVAFRDFARLVGIWQPTPPAPQAPPSSGEPFEIILGPKAKWFPLYTGYDPGLPGYHVIGDIASVTLRALADHPPDRLVLAIRTSPGMQPMLESFTFTAPLVKISGEPFNKGGLAWYKRANSSMPWQADPAVQVDKYLKFEVVGDEVRVTFLPPAIELLSVQCEVAWIDWYR